MEFTPVSLHPVIRFASDSPIAPKRGWTLDISSGYAARRAERLGLSGDPLLHFLAATPPIAA